MVNYNNGKIYKIENMSGDMCYIGSTTKDYLSKRMVQHRSDYKRFQHIEGVRNISVFRIFEKYGIDNCRIVLVELCPCDTRDELLKREAHYINTMECVNKYKPILTEEDKVEYRRQYRDAHRKELKSYDDAHSEARKQKVSCLCGSTFRNKDTKRHERSIKHKNHIANQPIDV